MVGRRRVGKSFLLARTLGGRRTISFQGDEQSERQHLDLLAEESGRTLFGAPSLSFASWDEALTFLGEQARRESLTVILDEFQWLKAAQPALDSILQRHWDRWDRDDVPITLVLSGSALTLMERMLERGAPLFGRATARPRIEPLDYRDAAAFATTSDPVALLRRWAVLGGTPQYQLWAGPGELRRADRRAHPRARTRRSTTSRATCCAKARASATPAPTSRSCARSRAAPRPQRDRAAGADVPTGQPRAQARAARGPRLRDRRPPTRPWRCRGTRELPHRRPVLPLLVPLSRGQPQPARVRPRGGGARRDPRRPRQPTWDGRSSSAAGDWAATYADEADLGRPREIGVVVVARRPHRDRRRRRARPPLRARRLVQVATHGSTSTSSPTRAGSRRRSGRRPPARSSSLFGRERFTVRLREAAAEEDVRLVRAADLFAS